MKQKYGSLLLLVAATLASSAMLTSAEAACTFANTTVAAKTAGHSSELPSEVSSQQRKQDSDKDGTDCSPEHKKAGHC